MKFKLEGSEWSQEEENSGVQNNEAIIDNEQADVVNTQDVQDELQDVQENVLKFNNEDEVLEFIKSKEDLYTKVAPRSEEKELPSDIKKYLEFKEETGRGYCWGCGCASGITFMPWIQL